MKDNAIKLGGAISVDELVTASEGRMDRARESFGLPPKPRPDEVVEDEAPEPVKPGPVKQEPVQRHAPAWYSSDPVELQSAVNDEATRLGVGADDPEVQTLAKRTWPDEVSYWRAVGSVLARRTARAETKAAKAESIGAGAAVSEASVTPGVVDTEDLIKELTEIQNGLRGSPTSPENRKKRADLRAQIVSGRG